MLGNPKPSKFETPLSQLPPPNNKQPEKPKATNNSHTLSKPGQGLQALGGQLGAAFDPMVSSLRPHCGKASVHQWTCPHLARQGVWLSWGKALRDLASGFGGLVFLCNQGFKYPIAPSRQRPLLWGLKSFHDTYFGQFGASGLLSPETTAASQRKDSRSPLTTLDK